MGWYNGSWLYRVKVTVQSSQVSANETDFPVYVDLSDLPAAFHTHVKSDGGDIRVTKADGTTEVPRELVFYDSTGDTGELHFKGDINASSDTDFYIYYGNSGASDYAIDATYGAQNVWNSNFLAVYHLQEAVNTDTDGYKDSTANASHGTGVSMAITAPDGKLAGKAAEFDGAADRITLPKILTNNTWSISGYMYLDTKNGSNGAPMYYQGGGASDLGTELGLIDTYPTASTETQFARSGGATLATGNDDNWTTATWYHIAATFNSTAVIFYFEGSAAGSSTVSGGTPDDATGALAAWYNYADGNRYLDGKLDEIRIRDDVATADYYATERSNLNAPSSFYSVGAEEQDTSSASPSLSPSISPSQSPSVSLSPSISPSQSPSVSLSPSLSPSISPSQSPSVSLSPSISPSQSPSVSLSPSLSPSISPSQSPSVSLSPSISPSQSPSVSLSPSISPSISPSQSPSVSLSPSISPSQSPSVSLSPSLSPSISPSQSPSVSLSPSISPSQSPSVSLSPSQSPSVSPSQSPSVSLSPSISPSQSPSVSLSPSISPSISPSQSPSVSLSPSISPSQSPSVSLSPSLSPSISPSQSPSVSLSPSISPSQSPSVSLSPSLSPSISPSQSPSVSLSPSISPSVSPSLSPSISPSVSPSKSPSLSPSISPSQSPSVSLSPSLSPSASPSLSPSLSPSISPSASPSLAYTTIMPGFRDTSRLLAREKDTTLETHGRSTHTQ